MSRQSDSGMPVRSGPADQAASRRPITLASASGLCRCQPDAGEDQRDAAVVVPVRNFVQKDRREDRAEDRHQVDEEAGLAGTDLADGPVVEDVAKGNSERCRRRAGWRKSPSAG